MMSLQCCLVTAATMLLLSSRGSDCSEVCDSPLGMENGKIGDGQITAPSWLYFDRSYTLYYRPHYGRLNYEKGGGAWCSEEVEKLPDQFLEIDLGSNTRLTAIATQGRFRGSEYVDQFGITYKREGDAQYRRHTENGQWKIMAGNNDTGSIVISRFAAPFVARWIRIVPRGNLFTIYCLRTELYGCRWTKSRDDLLQYTSHVGYRDGSSDFRDIDYDGTTSSRLGLVTNGLGRLTDDVYGRRLADDGALSKWVGFSSRHPVISFEFAKTRIFRSVTFHVYNQASAIRVFAKVDIEISLSGVNFTLVASQRTTETERATVGPLSVKVNLGGVVSRFVKCKLSQLGSAVLVSEVDFTSEAFTAVSRAPITTQRAAPLATRPPLTTQQPEEEPLRTDAVVQTTEGAVTRQQTSPRWRDHWGASYGRGQLPAEGEQGVGGLSFPIVIAIVLGSVVAVVVLVLLVVRECRRLTHKHRARMSADRLNTGSKGADEIPDTDHVMLSFQDSTQYGNKARGSGHAFSPLNGNVV